MVVVAAAMVEERVTVVAEIATVEKGCCALVDCLAVVTKTVDTSTLGHNFCTAVPAMINPIRSVGDTFTPAHALLTISASITKPLTHAGEHGLVGEKSEAVQPAIGVL